MTDRTPLREAELLPCPFCGGEGELVNDADDAGPRVNCTSCDMEGPRAYWVDYLSMSAATTEAARLWNTRTPPLSSPEQIERVARAMRVAYSECDFAKPTWEQVTRVMAEAAIAALFLDEGK